MSSNNNIESQASQWSVVLSSGDADKHTLADFNAWREADPRHEHEFQKVDRVWQGMEQLEHLRAFATLPQQPQATKQQESLLSRLGTWLTNVVQHPYPLAGAAAFIVILGISVVWLQVPINPQQSTIASTHYNTNHAEIRSFHLKDDSQITLAPDSEVIVSYSKGLREVQLISGEGLFEVSKNPERPFVVRTGNTETRVLGTVFSVKRSLKYVDVTVKEGKVSVAPTHAKEKNTLLTPGQGLTATLEGSIGAIKTIDIASIGSWVSGRLVYEDASLKDIITDANHYYEGKILLGSTETGELRLAISFSTDNIDQMLDNLAQLLPITLNRNRPGTVVLTKK